MGFYAFTKCQSEGSSWVGDSRRLTCGFAGHGEEGGDPERGPPGHGVHVHPEGDPWDDHDQNGRDVGLNHVEADGTTQMEAGHQAAIVTWKEKDKLK